MIEILRLGPGEEERLHPYVLKCYRDWHERILRVAPQLRGLSTEQTGACLRTYLDENELAEFSKCVDGIVRWLSECMDAADTYFPKAYALWVVTPMFRVESLLVTACRRAEAEQRRKKCRDQWCAAHVYLDPPTDDAKKYLDGKDEREFKLALARAIQAYLEKGPAYETDLRTLDYVQWLEKIEKLKKEEARKMQASRAAAEYSEHLNQQIKDLASRLDRERIALADYFEAKIQDRSYRNCSFHYALSKEDETNLDATLIRVANRKLEQLLSSDLRHFVNLPPRYYRLYYPLPVANYRLQKEPCIGIGFEIFAAAYAEVSLRPGKKNINGYEFALPLIEDGNGLVQLDRSRFLAYHRLILTPEELGGYVFWMSIPLILLTGLLTGETRPDGCTISAASDSVTTYRVQGFEKEVDVPDQFAEYLKSIGSIDEMIALGIMPEKVGRIIKVALGELGARREAPPTKARAGRTGSMKERALRLFDQGKRPSDPELRALGIKPNTAYRYYQQWKRRFDRS